MFFHVVRNAGLGSSQQHTAEGQPGDVLKDVGVFHGFGGSSAPRKGRMAGNQYPGNSYGIEIFRVKEPNDDCTGVPYVGFIDFRSGEGLGDRNRAVEVVGVGGAETRNGAAGLCPRCGELRMGVDDAADLRKFAVKQSVRIEIARRPREPSTMLPSRSVTTRSEGLRLE